MVSLTSDIIPESRWTRKPIWRKYKAHDSSACMKALSEEIYCKSTLCDFLLMVSSNRCRITDRLRDFFAYRGWKSPFCPPYSALSFRVPGCQKLQMTAQPGLAQDALWLWQQCGCNRLHRVRGSFVMGESVCRRKLAAGHGLQVIQLRANSSDVDRPIWLNAKTLSRHDCNKLPSSLYRQHQLRPAATFAFYTGITC